MGAVLTTEYLLLGGLAGLVGSAAAAVLSWTLVHFVFGDVWEPRPLLYAAGWGATALLVAVAGLTASLDVLMKKPLQVLREE